MPEYGFSLMCIFSYKDRIVDFVLILENMGKRKLIFSQILWNDTGGNETSYPCVNKNHHPYSLFKM